MLELGSPEYLLLGHSSHCPEPMLSQKCPALQPIVALQLSTEEVPAALHVLSGHRAHWYSEVRPVPVE